MTIANSEEREFWSGPSGQSWITFEGQQDRLLSGVSDAVLAHANLAFGERILDIGCGTGALSVAAADLVGEAGHVLATDISKPMLSRAAERLAPFPQARTLFADVQTVDWQTPSFDGAISRFGVMFFADPPAAFANIAAALRPGARMTFAAWAPVAENPYWRDPPRIAADRLGPVPKSTPNSPGPMGLADRDWSLAQFRSAGLEDVECLTVDVPLAVDGSPTDAADLALVIGPAARVVRLHEATPGDRMAIRDAIAEEFSCYREGDRVQIPATILIYTARVV